MIQKDIDKIRDTLKSLLPSCASFDISYELGHSRKDTYTMEGDAPILTEVPKDSLTITIRMETSKHPPENTFGETTTGIHLSTEREARVYIDDLTKVEEGLELVITSFMDKTINLL